jgi:hypothetical protein
VFHGSAKLQIKRSGLELEGDIALVSSGDCFDRWFVLAKGRLLLWIPAFFVMGVACLVNAARCARVHCYVTGPLSLLVIIYVIVAEFHLVPMNAGYFLDSILGVSILTFLIEIPLGRYRKRV